MGIIHVLVGCCWYISNDSLKHILHKGTEIHRLGYL